MDGQYSGPPDAYPDLFGHCRFSCVLTEDDGGSQRLLCQAFYDPNKDRTNLTILTSALAHHVILTQVDDDVTATGVEFGYNGKVYTVNAKRDVILCAG